MAVLLAMDDLGMRGEAPCLGGWSREDGVAAAVKLVENMMPALPED